MTRHRRVDETAESLTCCEKHEFITNHWHEYSTVVNILRHMQWYTRGVLREVCSDSTICNHPYLDDFLMVCNNHPILDDSSHPLFVLYRDKWALDDYCSLLFYIETNEHWMITAYHEKIIQIWIITDSQKLSIFGTGPYLTEAYAVVYKSKGMLKYSTDLSPPM